MSKIYALLKPDDSLLVARKKGTEWVLSTDIRGADPRGQNVTVFLNGLDVLGVSAIIPARNENQAHRAAPFAIEDELAEPVETSHVALAPPNKAEPDTPRQMNVTSNAAMQGLAETLAGLGLSEASIVAAHSVLPSTDILFEGPGLLLGRLGERSFAVDASLGRDVVISLIHDYPAVDVYGQRVAQAIGRTARGDGATTLEAFLIQLIAWAESGNGGINLRQGQFEPRRSVDLGEFKQWKFAGALAAVAALGWFGSMILETNAMNDRTSELQGLAAEFARVGWPEANGDIQQVLAATNSQRGPAGLAFPSVLDATAVLYDALAQVEGSELRTIRYDRLRQQMTATVAFESFADVDQLTTLVNASGLSARSGDSRQSGSKVIGDLTLEPAQ